MRQSIEKYQIVIYLTAIACGLLVGSQLPDRTAPLQTMLWPVLALLLYGTFTQVPLVRLREAFSDSRFLKAAVMGNFVLLPMVVWGLSRLAPDEPAVRFGVLLVLLVPCTDWFITFTHLGGGDTRHAILFSPISLLLQILLLPVYFWLFLAEVLSVNGARGDMLAAFLGLIVLPLMAAYGTEKWVEGRRERVALLERLAWLPVPLLAAVVFIIAATQVGLVMGSLHVLGRLSLVYVAFLIVAGLMALVLARLFGLPVLQGRVLAFSLGTRNSFVVLPLALALPPFYELAVVAVVYQSLIELLGMAVYLWWVPKRLFPKIIAPSPKDPLAAFRARGSGRCSTERQIKDRIEERGEEDKENGTPSRCTSVLGIISRRSGRVSRRRP